MRHLAIIAVVGLISAAAMWWHWPEDRSQDVIDTLERINDAELSEGDVDADRNVILDFLRGG